MLQEIRPNIKEKLEDWNHSVQEWLRRYIFLRVCSEEEGRLNPKKSVLASNVAFAVSAFWHGFYPGYYFGFFQVFLLQSNSKFIYKAGDKFKFIPKGPIRYILVWFLTSTFLNDAGVFFCFLTLTPILHWIRVTYYLPTLISLVVFTFFSVTGWGQRSGRPSKKPETGKTPEAVKVPDAKTEKTE
eukprot:CAMPEP_0176467316 /NCGR_PEP_ID=MMETSP0127-20121128/38392_1 /TAXON_ID=938130 /ORGANISM="Platyophrya macrostoma, Strain WH" /LENGTH=184 /DNA_ID=CAMNT_0017860605 /DNA_START=118 /DNA_END=672 /DNA_ORIENTATION=+